MKVLIVDDEPFITQGLSLLIDWEKEGFEIAACLENGKEALQFLEKNEVDLILWLVEPTTYIGAGEKSILEQIKNACLHLADFEHNSFTAFVVLITVETTHSITLLFFFHGSHSWLQSR